MRKIGILAASAALSIAGVAVAQDAAPPGCKWIGDGVLACKDGKGYWRRSGDDQIVGTYPLAKPKPKPAPAAAASSAPVAPAAVAAAPAAASVAPPAAPEPAPVGPPAEAAMDAALPPAPAAEASAIPPVAPAVVEAAPEAPKPWWRRWLDSVWRDIQSLLRLFGIGR